MDTNNEVLKAVKDDYDIHFSRLFQWINGTYHVNKEQIDELKKVLTASIKQAKETKNPVLINAWCGEFDLLVTDLRIHVILMHKTFELPNWE